MDKIILSSNDIITLLKWRDQNKDLVRRNAAPFKGIMLEFPDTHIDIKVYTDGGKLSFYLYISGNKAGKITGLQLPGGFFKETKNTTELNKENTQTIITVYSSLMAFIVYNEPEKATAATRKQHQETQDKRKSGKQGNKKGITYIFSSSKGNPQLQPQRKHASPSAAFSVRGHYRHYKNGKKVWIKPYNKGTGTKKDKTYKLN